MFFETFFLNASEESLLEMDSWELYSGGNNLILL